MPLNDRDRRALMWGGAVIAALLLYLVTRGGGGGAPQRIEPAGNDLLATVPADQPATYAAPVQPPAVVPIVAAPSVDVSQLRLVGLLSRGAVVAMADGSQRFVAIGREIVPGVTLRGVGVHDAILATPSGEVRLGFDNGAQPDNAVVAAPPIRAGTPPTP